MESCIFCKIIKNEIPAKKLLESDKIIAFEDINPEAPFHALVIPKVHLIAEEINKNPDLLGEMIKVANTLAIENDVNSYRMIMNIGKDAGQQISHIHIHVLGGKNLGSKLIAS